MVHRELYPPGGVGSSRPGQPTARRTQFRPSRFAAYSAASAAGTSRSRWATGAGYAATPGNLGAWLMYRIEGDRAEVQTLSLWASMDAIHGFAGGDVERAVFYPEDDRFLVDRDLVAHHWVVGGVAEPSAR